MVAAENKSRNDLIGLSGYAVETHIVPQKPHRKWNLLHILPFFWPYDYLHGEYDMRRVAFDLIDRVKFDLVLCTHTYGYFPVSTAYAVAKKAKIPLVIDIRDLAEQNPNLSFFEMSFNQKMDYLRSKFSFVSRSRAACYHRKAAALTAISPWHTEWLKRWNPNSFCIYNGFDPELFKPVEPVMTDRFIILYAGSLATRIQRNPDLLLRAIRSLFEKGVITPSDFVVQFYGEPTGSHVIGAARELGVEDFLEFHPLVPISEMSGLFSRASALLVLGAEPGKYATHGIMTTKFFEYLAANRPILLVPGDRECLAQAIIETNSGFAANSVGELEQFILGLYNEWKKDGFVHGHTAQDKLKLYSREYQAGQFALLFEKVVAQDDLQHVEV